MYFNVADEQRAIDKINYEEELMAFDFPNEYETEDAARQRRFKLIWVNQSRVRLQMAIASLGTYIGDLKSIKRKSIILKAKFLEHPTWDTLNEIKMLMDKYEQIRKEVEKHGF